MKVHLEKLFDLKYRCWFKVLSIILSVFMAIYNKRENDRRDRVYGIPDPDGSDCNPLYADDPERLKKWGLEGKTKLEIIELGDSHPAFRSVLLVSPFALNKASNNRYVGRYII